MDQLGALTTDKDIVPIRVETPIEEPRAITEEERNFSVSEVRGRARAKARIRAFKKKKAKEAAKEATILVPVEGSVSCCFLSLIIFSYHYDFDISAWALQFIITG